MDVVAVCQGPFSGSLENEQVRLLAAMSKGMWIMSEEKLFAKAATAANLMLAVAGTLCLSVLSYFIYYYGWTGQRRFASPVGVWLYYVGPAAMAALLFASLRLRVSNKINVVLCSYSVVVAIYLFEIGANVWFTLPSVRDKEADQALANAAKGVKFDTRSRTEVIQDLRKQGIDAGPSIFPQGLLTQNGDHTLKSEINLNGLEVLPLASISNRPTVVCNETGDYLVYTSDEHGFHNPPHAWETRPIEVVALGDSFVQGYCVPSDRDFVAQIRKRYSATLSIGIEGNGPLMMLASIKEYAEILKPKVILWFHYEGNDLSDLVKERDSPLLTRYLTDGFRQGLIDRQADIDRALSNYIEPALRKTEVRRKMEEVSAALRSFPESSSTIVSMLKLSELRNRLNLVQGLSGRPGTNSPQSGGWVSQVPELPDFFHQVLLEAKRSTEAWGGRLYFVYLPSLERYLRQPVLYSDRDWVLQSATDAGIPVIDIHQTFTAYKDPLAFFPFRLAGHYTEEGHRLVAQEVLRVISRDF